ncbi:MAG: hypothetical protein JWO13_413 [Acidobacteriales bacterium]|nr:hypothetical protein [Terriglobales bacterium]
MQSRFVSFFVLVLLFQCISVAQANKSTGADGPKHDETAIGLLTRMSDLAGWKNGHIPADVTATGSMIFLDAEGKPSLSTPLTLQARGNGQISLELDESGKKHRMVAAGPLAASSSGPLFLPVHAVKSIAFPFMTDLTAANDPNVNVEILSADSISPNKLKLWREPSNLKKLTKAEVEGEREFSTLIVWLSPESSVPLQIEYRKGTGSLIHGTPCIRKFSDYRPVQGIMVPFHQEEWVDGAMIYAINFAEVSFDKGLTDADFSTATLKREK